MRRRILSFLQLLDQDMENHEFPIPETLGNLVRVRDCGLFFFSGAKGGGWGGVGVGISAIIAAELVIVNLNEIGLKTSALPCKIY